MTRKYRKLTRRELHCVVCCTTFEATRKTARCCCDRCRHVDRIWRKKGLKR